MVWSVEALTVVYEDMEIEYSISLGISQASTDSGDYMKWLESADNALYTSKESGWNQTTIYRPKSDE